MNLALNRMIRPIAVTGFFFVGVLFGHSGDTLDAPYGTKPVLDGFISFGEWDDADTVMTIDLPGGPVLIYAKENPDSLYIAVHVSDSASNPTDRVLLNFDTLNNAGNAPQTDDFECSVRRNGTSSGFIGNGTGWTNDSIYGWNSAVSSAAASWSVEFAISFWRAGLTPNIFKIIGFSTEILDKNNLTVTWPDSMQSNVPNTWGDLYSSDNWASIDTVGPAAFSASISPPNPPPGITQIVVYAAISDSFSGQSSINGAEVFLDSVGQTGTGFAMAALDGGFDEVLEDVFDTIPVSGWVAGDTHWVYVHGRDIANNWGGFDSVVAYVTTVLDTIPPGIAYTVPADGQTGVALDSWIYVTFTEPVDPVTVTSDKITIIGSIHGTYTFIMNYNQADSTLTIEPDINFAPLESVCVSIAPGIQDLAGNPMLVSYSWWFKTVAIIDSTGPVTFSASISPPNPPPGITQIVAYATISDSFSGQSSINGAEVFLDSVGQTGTGFAMAALDGGFDEVLEDVFDTIPVSGWVAGDTHWVYVHGRDIANNWGGFDSAVVYVTTVLDTIPPGIAYTVPADGQTGVALNSWIYVTFTEPVDVATVTSDKIMIEGSINGIYTFWMSYYETDSTLRINPYNDFAPLESVNVYIAAGIRDLTGNPMLNGYWWWFRTGTTVDTIRPQVNTMSVVPDTVGLTGNTVLTATISDNDKVVSAEYFIDSVGIAGTGYMVHPVDSFGSQVVDVFDTIVTDTLVPGQYKVFLRGVDFSGNWSLCDSAVFVKQLPVPDTLGPGFDILIEPSTADIGDSVLITAVASELLSIDSSVACTVWTATNVVHILVLQPDSLTCRGWLNTVGFTDGACRLKISGYDLAGNYGSDTAAFTLVVEGEFFPEKMVYAWPNPARSNRVNFHFYVNANADVTVEVFNLEGKRVWTGEGRGEGGRPPHQPTSNAIVWDISNIASDIYLFRIIAASDATGEKKAYIKKFAIVK